MKTKREKWIKYECMFAFLKLLDIWFLVVEGERVSNENQKEEVNKIWMHVCLFKIAGYLYCFIF